MLSFFRRLIQHYGFFRREPDIYHRSGSTVGPLVSADEVWAAHGFFTAEKRRNERLAQIARERDALKISLAKAIKQKKSRQAIYAALRALRNEEMFLERGGIIVRNADKVVCEGNTFADYDPLDSLVVEGNAVVPLRLSKEYLEGRKA